MWGNGYGHGYGQGHGWMGDGFWFGGLIHGVLGVVVTIVVAVAAVALVRFLWRLGSDAAGATTSATVQASDALAALDMRYARGEIERDDYLQRRSDLDTPALG